MTEPSAQGGRPTGLLLVRGPVDPVASWAGKGLTAVRVVPLDRGWCALVPSATTSAAPPPYDDPVSLLLGRPVPQRMRPAFGVAVVHGQALLTATPSRWRAVQRWLAWRPGAGLVRPGGLPTLRLSDAVHLAGVVDPGAVAAVADIVHRPDGDPVDVLRDLLTVLRLPGGDLLGAELGEGSSHPGALAVEPSVKGSQAFGRMVAEDASWRDEMEGRS